MTCFRPIDLAARLSVDSLAVAFLFLSAVASAQTTGGTTSGGSGASQPAPAWSFNVSAATYLLPHDDNYLQPTVTADRDALHIEGRYNYEDLHSVSGFVGWTFEAGDKVKLALTPMFGGVAGDTKGVGPALELTLTFGRLEVYSEGEYIIGVDHTRSFLYNWSEVSVWATEWLRAGLATQRTRTFRRFGTTRDIQRGLLTGVAVGSVEGVVYLFNPGSDDYYVVATINVGF